MAFCTREQGARLNLEMAVIAGGSSSLPVELTGSIRKWVLERRLPAFAAAEHWQAVLK